MIPVNGSGLADRWATQRVVDGGSAGTTAGRRAGSRADRAAADKSHDRHL